MGKVGCRQPQHLTRVGDDQLTQLARLAEGDGAEAMLDALSLQGREVVVGVCLCCMEREWASPESATWGCTG